MKWYQISKYFNIDNIPKTPLNVSFSFKKNIATIKINNVFKLIIDFAYPGFLQYFIA